jgi:hypothetical protein
MVVHFLKRFSREVLKRVNGLIAKRGKETGIEALSSLQDDDNSSD